MKTLEETLRAFMEKHKDDKPPLFDFAKHAPRQCAKCGWPFASGGPYKFPMKSIDCPEHRPVDRDLDRMVDADIEHEEHGV